MCGNDNGVDNTTAGNTHTCSLISGHPHHHHHHQGDVTLHRAVTDLYNSPHCICIFLPPDANLNKIKVVCVKLHEILSLRSVDVGCNNRQQYLNQTHFPCCILWCMKINSTRFVCPCVQVSKLPHSRREQFVRNDHSLNYRPLPSTFNYYITTLRLTGRGRVLGLGKIMCNM